MDYAGRCSRCPAYLFSIFLLIFILLLELLLLLLVTVVVVQNWKASSSVAVVATVTWVIVFSAAQTLSLLGYVDMQWPQPLQETFLVISMVFGFQLHKIQAVNCLLVRNGVNALWFSAIYSFFGILAVPLIASVATVMVRVAPDLLAVYEIREGRQNLIVNAEERNKAILQKRLFNKDGSLYIKEHQRKALFLNSLQVVLTFIFQTSCQSTLQVFNCFAVDYGPLGVLRFVKVDMSVNCDSQLYQRESGYSMFLLFMYTCCIPLGSVFAVAYARRKFADEDFRLYTAFFTLGLTDSAFYWSGLILVRKAIVIILTVFMETSLLQLFIVYFLTASLWAQYYICPWMSAYHNRVDLWETSFLVVVTNIGLAFVTLTAAPSVEAFTIIEFALVSAFFAYALWELTVRNIQVIYSDFLRHSWKITEATGVSVTQLFKEEAPMPSSTAATGVGENLLPEPTTPPLVQLESPTRKTDASTLPTRLPEQGSDRFSFDLATRSISSSLRKTAYVDTIQVNQATNNKEQDTEEPIVAGGRNHTASDSSNGSGSFVAHSTFNCDIGEFTSAVGIETTVPPPIPIKEPTRPAVLNDVVERAKKKQLQEIDSFSSSSDLFDEEDLFDEL
jgi:hypothetical protein